MKILFPLSLIAAVQASDLEAQEIPQANLCDIVQQPDEFVGRTVLVDARIYLDAHGVYSDVDACPDAALWTGPAIRDRELAIRIREAGSAYWDQRPLVRVKAIIEKRPFRVPLSAHVVNRLRLSVLEIISVDAVQ